MCLGTRTHACNHSTVKQEDLTGYRSRHSLSPCHWPTGRKKCDSTFGSVRQQKFLRINTRICGVFNFETQPLQFFSSGACSFYPVYKLFPFLPAGGSRRQGMALLCLHVSLGSVAPLLALLMESATLFLVPGFLWPHHLPDWLGDSVWALESF